MDFKKYDQKFVRQNSRSISSASIPFLVIGLVLSGLYSLPPRFVVHIPANCFIHAVLKAHNRFPTKLRLQLGSVHGVTPIVSRPVLYESYEGFGLSQSFVDTTICGGKVLMEGKKLTIGLDEEAIAAKSLELSRKLWERF